MHEAKDRIALQRGYRQHLQLQIFLRAGAISGLVVSFLVILVEWFLTRWNAIVELWEVGGFSALLMSVTHEFAHEAPGGILVGALFGATMSHDIGSARHVLMGPHFFGLSSGEHYHLP